MKNPNPSTGNPPLKVLIVDDDKFFHENLKIAPSFKDKYELSNMFTPEEAIEAIREKHYDLILVDILLDPEDENLTPGLKLIEDIKQIDRALPICAISKSRKHIHFIQAIKHGANYFLRKKDFEEFQWEQLFLEIIIESRVENKPTILVVDDNEKFYRNLQLEFNREFKFQFAISLEQAEEKMLESTFDLIILDIYFGEGDSSPVGLDFYELNLKEKGPFIPVIIASKKFDHGLIHRTGLLGIEDFLDKRKFNKKDWLGKIQRNISVNKQLLKIFISHASQDKKPFIDTLFLDLSSNQTKPLMDSKEFKYGKSLVNQISTGIYSCEIFLLALSKNSTKKDEAKNTRTLSRPWIYEEHEFALNLQRCGHIKKILPIFLDKEAMNAEIKTKDNGIGVVKDLKLAPCFFPMDGETEEEAYQRGFDQLLQALKEYR